MAEDDRVLFHDTLSRLSELDILFVTASSACHAAQATHRADFVPIPEVPFSIDETNGLAPG